MEGRYFDEKITDLLDNLKLAPSVGREEATVNVGKMSNRGFEYSMRLEVIKNKRPAPTNAVFFPSAQMKNVRHKPNYPTETQAIPARTQTAAHHIEVAIIDRTGFQIPILV